MQFLRTLFWVVLAVIAAVFSVRNWTPVPVNLWGGLVAYVKLPVLVFGAFLLGLLPATIVLKTTRWRLRRRLETTERAMNEFRPAVTVPSPPSQATVPVDPALPGAPPPTSF